MYERTDEIIRKLNRALVLLFAGFSAKPDELNVLPASATLYQQVDSLTRKALLRAAKSQNDLLDEAFVYAILMEYDPVVKYVYEHEVDRKRMRFAEAYIASNGDRGEVKKALRLWSAMAAQYAITVTDEAVIQNCIVNGIKHVKWITQPDERRCGDCADRDGEIYPIDRIPPKPHIGCRCYYEPVRDR